MFKLHFADCGLEYRTRSEAIDAARRISLSLKPDENLMVVKSDGVSWLERWRFNQGVCCHYEISAQQRINDEVK